MTTVHGSWLIFCLFLLKLSNHHVMRLPLPTNSTTAIKYTLLVSRWSRYHQNRVKCVSRRAGRKWTAVLCVLYVHVKHPREGRMLHAPSKPSFMSVVFLPLRKQLYCVLCLLFGFLFNFMYTLLFHLIYLDISLISDLVEHTFAIILNAVFCCSFFLPAKMWGTRESPSWGGIGVCLVLINLIKGFLSDQVKQTGALDRIEKKYVLWCTWLYDRDWSYYLK